MANTRDSIFEIAQSLGYESASAFTKAFKKIMGCSPRQYSRSQNSISGAYRQVLSAPMITRFASSLTGIARSHA
jgi:AraC-like DNA-binding protein